ncbi:DNA mismatch repair protein MutS [bacterium]|nr:DNA mismatch repair protein MutS [bacterium]
MARREKLTLMKQYNSIKAKYPNSLLLFRMGDFYETFGDDAKIASEVLGITLTSRDHGEGSRTPLAGIPYHSLDRYLKKLLDAGIRVAICEQLEDPKLARGLVKRDVVEIITPGTITISEALDEGRKNFLLALFPVEEKFALSYIDVLCGDFYTKTIPPSRLSSELMIISPAEVLVPGKIDGGVLKVVKSYVKNITYVDDWKFDYRFAADTLKEFYHVNSLDGFSQIPDEEIVASGVIIDYLRGLKKVGFRHISFPRGGKRSDYLELGESTVRNLELIRSFTGHKEEGSLLGSIDETVTPMGKRLLREWLLRPLCDREKIEERLSAVDEAIQHLDLTETIREYLSGIGDIERLSGKIGARKAGPRDIAVLREALRLVPKIRKTLELFYSKKLVEIRENIEDFSPLLNAIERTILPDPPARITEGGVIRDGVSSELDELRSIRDDAQGWLKNLEASLRQRTGISKLRVGYNKVFGYYIEVTKSFLDRVPDDFIRKQTLVQAERFITPELKQFEEKILSSSERIVEIEKGIFEELLHFVEGWAFKLRNLAQLFSQLDLLLGFATLAVKKRYCRPVIREDDRIIIKEGRHPVIEDFIGASAYTPNDTFLSNDRDQILVVTGPNMSGKSTYLRQTGLIVIMAHMGCFVPATSAEICLVDKLFTRVGAYDNIARGQSTFLVEMVEVANILNNATSRSLVLLDEIGRGTSTFDGLSIAWAVAECLHNHKTVRPKTILATHYHELTELATYLPRVKNLQVIVKRVGENIHFTHKIMEGGCDDSYGIEVARLAGLPEETIGRAREILEALETGKSPISSKAIFKKSKKEKYGGYQISLFEPEYHPLIQALRELDIDNITPIQALEILSHWKEKWKRF